MLSRFFPTKSTHRALAAITAVIVASLSCDSSTGPGDGPTPSLEQSTVTASANTIVADGKTTAQITVVLRDDAGAPVGRSAGAVSMSTTRGTLSAVTDQTNGSYTATLTSATAAGLAIVSASLAGAALGDTAGVAFVTNAPATITIANGASNNQTAVAGLTVANPPSVKVADANGTGVPNITVTFAVAGGGGSITGATQTTDESGVAIVGSWTLGNAAGPNTLTAAAAGVSQSVTFNATGIAGPAASIAIANAASNNQSAAAGSSVAIAPSVKVTDARGNAVAGVSVTFSIASGGGSITGANAATDASGVAAVGSWTLGATAGTNTLTATAGSLAGSPVTFSATGTAGAAGNLAIVAGNTQTAVAGSTVAIAPSVKLTDANGNPVPGAIVSFGVASGGGSVTGGSVTTDAGGIATVGSWRLGIAAGTNTLSVSSGAVAPVTFTATGIAGAAASISINAGNNQTAAAGTAVAIPPSAKVTDSNGNAVEGAGVTFAVTTGGGSIAGASVTTNASGVATVGSWTLGSVAGPNTLTATLNGVSGQSVAFTATGSALAALVVTASGRIERSQTASVSVFQDGAQLSPSSVTLTLVPADGGTVNSDGTIKLLKAGSLTINATAGTRSGSTTVTVAQPPLIVFDLVRNFTRQIWQVAIDGGDLVQLTNTGSDNQHGSRVGNKLVYAGARNGRSFDLFSLNLLTSAESQLTNTSFAERDPNLSPNGNRLVFVSNESGIDRAVYANADGTGSAFVDDISSNTGAIEISPAWSPGSDKVILSSTSSGGPDIWIAHTLGGIAAKMPATVNTASTEVSPVWNSSGQIAFHTNRSGSDEIWVTDVNGSSASRLTAGTSPAWLKDGRLVFTRFSGSTASLFWIDPANPQVVIPIDVGGGDAQRPSAVMQ